MGLFSIFRSAPKAIEAASDIATKSVDGIISGIDNMKFTDQEKAEMAKKVWEQFIPAWLELQKTMASESSITGMSRRILAFMIMGVFLSLIVGSAAAYKVDPKWAEFIAAECIGRLEFLAGGVGLTYFVYYGVTKFFQKGQ